MAKEMSTVTPLAYKHRRHSAMYENILIRQICEFNPPTDPSTIYEVETQQIPEAKLSSPPKSKRKFSAAKEHEHLVICTKDELESVGDKITQEFNKFMELESSRYFYFSESTGFLQAENVDTIFKLLKTKNYWLNIKEPTQEDLTLLQKTYGVHELTISEIKERDTPEKIEVFQDYTFISLRLMVENIGDDADEENSTYNVDMDFNIILFKDLVITVHYKEWSNMCVMLGFLNLLSANTHHCVPIQDWVLVSCFIELRQDAHKIVAITKAQINQARLECDSNNDMDMNAVGTMEQNFEMELQVFAISRYIKPKMKILKEFRKRNCGNRLNVNTRILCSDLYDDFHELNNDLGHFYHILARSQDNFLAILRERHGQRDNDLNRSMKWVSQMALLITPKNTVSMIMGMNICIPLHFSTCPSLIPFWTIFAIGLFIGAVTLYWLIPTRPNKIKSTFPDQPSVYKTF